MDSVDENVRQEPILEANRWLDHRVLRDVRLQLYTVQPREVSGMRIRVLPRVQRGLGAQQEV